MEGGVWQATAHGVAKSWTRLSNFTFTSYTLSVRAQTHLPKFPETSLNKGKERYKKIKINP